MLTVEGKDVIKTMGKIIFFYVLCIKLCFKKAQEGHICTTCYLLGVVGLYCVQQFVFVTNVANKSFSRLSVEGKNILRRSLNRNDSE